MATKIKAEFRDGKLYFKHFVVKKESETMYGVYDDCSKLITSGTTLNQAAKKAKLLELGYQMGYEKARDIYDEGWDWR